MNPAAKSRRILAAVVTAVALVAAFLAGRSFSGGGGSAVGASGPPAAEKVPRDFRSPAAEGTWDGAWASGTAAERTLAVLDSIERCTTREDFLAAIATIQKRADKTEQKRFLAYLFAAWLESDPVAALSEVRRIESLRHHAPRVMGSFQTWAALNPDDAVVLLRQVLDGRQSDAEGRPPFLDGVDPPEYLLSIVAGLGQSDPSLAATTLARAAGSPVRKSAIEVLLQGWYPAEPAAVRQWAASISDDETRRLALATTATKAGQQDELDPALEWAANLPDPRDQEVALQALTSQWSERNAAAAFAWCSQLPDGDLKFSLMPDVLRQLTIVDPGEAADWLNQYEAGPEMDASIAAYAKGVQFINPAAALGSAHAITDPQLRETVIRRIRKNQRRAPPVDRPRE